jgi:TonB family protein
MSEAEITAADRVPQEGDPPWPFDERGVLAAPAGEAIHPEAAPFVLGEAPAAPLMRPPIFASRSSEGGVLAAAASLAAHVLVIGVLLYHAPWDNKGSLQDEDEISVEIVDSLPQTAPSPEPSAEQAQPTASEAKTSDTALAPVPPPNEMTPPVPEVEANAPPADAPPPPIETQAPPPVLSAPALESEAQLPPPPPEPAVRRAEPTKAAPPAVDLAQHERTERLERERRGEAERAAHERAARAAEAAKRLEAQRQETQRQAAQHQEAERQAQAKAAEAAAANAVASAYRGSVLSHLASFKRYPPAARARGVQGNPAVSFSIDASGRVISVSLTRASGDPDIDAEIVAMVHRASPFPAPPPGAPHVFSAGVNFRLQ